MRAFLLTLVLVCNFSMVPYVEDFLYGMARFEAWRAYKAQMERYRLKEEWKTRCVRKAIKEGRNPNSCSLGGW